MRQVPPNLQLDGLNWRPQIIQDVVYGGVRFERDMAIQEGELELPAGGTDASTETATQATGPMADVVSATLDFGDDRADTPRAIDGDAIGAALSPKTARFGLMFADLIAIIAGYAATFGLQAAFRPVPDFVRADHVFVATLSIPVWLLALMWTKSYVARHVDRAAQEVSCVMRSARIVAAIVVVASFLSQFEQLSRVWVVSTIILVTITLLIERGLARALFSRLRHEGRMSRRILIAGTGTDAISLLHSIKSDPSLGYDVVGFLGDEDIGEREGCRVLGTCSDAQRILRETGANGAVVSVASLEPQVVNRLTRELTDVGAHVALSSSLYDIDVTRFRPQALGGRTLFYVERTVRHGWRATAKRIFDVTLASIVLLLTSPIVAVAAILIKRESPGPVVFRQERVGRDGRLFTILKLRTMCNDAEARKADLASQNEADGPLFKIEHDPRITRVGRILRKLSIDELPQLWNVLRGQMSLVGPRPALPSEVEHWDDDLHDRLRVLPGITGMWQVSGRSDASFDDYARFDLYYVDNWSLAKDLTILARTFAVVAQSKGAS